MRPVPRTMVSDGSIGLHQIQLRNDARVRHGNSRAARPGSVAHSAPDRSTARSHRNRRRIRPVQSPASRIFDWLPLRSSSQCERRASAVDAAPAILQFGGDGNCPETNLGSTAITQSANRASEHPAPVSLDVRIRRFMRFTARPGLVSIGSQRHRRSLVSCVPPHQRSIGLCRLKSSLCATIALPNSVSDSRLRRYAA